MKHFLSVQDAPDVDTIIQEALAYKQSPRKDGGLGEGKTMGLLFLNPSLRTRISTQIAARNLGMETIVFNVDKEGWQLEFHDGAIMNGSTVEHVKEAAAVIGQYVQVLGIRTFPGLVNREDDYSELYIRQFVKYAGVPVVSLESATVHPLQSLADAVTIRECWKENRKPRVVMTWAPHVKALPQAVPNSFAQWMNAWGAVDFVIAHPKGYELHPDFAGKATVVHNQNEALKGADFVYVKNWSSYQQYGKIVSQDSSWMMTAQKLTQTRQAKVMHCLPVRRNLVIADEVLDGPQSVVIQEAGNRVWAAQAVLSRILREL
ncbi:MAG: N-acetylornithine carbamoyltransferase [Cyclobacteriaceae bacterium]|nr:N-acetylornithine carbamoyltransferase [Cyclobacteriaceae bacterium]